MCKEKYMQGKKGKKEKHVCCSRDGVIRRFLALGMRMGLGVSSGVLEDVGEMSPWVSRREASEPS